MSWSYLAPKRPAWFRWCGVISAAALSAFLIAAWFRPWSPGRVGGLAAGTIASMIFVVDALYPLRRRLLGWPFRTAQSWLQFHLYGGVMASVLVGIHTGFRWPGGWFGWMLVLLTTWTTVSGLLGVWLQKFIPSLIVKQSAGRGPIRAYPDLVARLQAQADVIAANASEMLERTYRTEIRPALAEVSPSWSYLFDISGSRERRLGPLRHIGQFLDR